MQLKSATQGTMLLAIQPGKKKPLFSLHSKGPAYSSFMPQIIILKIKWQGIAFIYFFLQLYVTVQRKAEPNLQIYIL
jgi:hypothetical protein